jgi:hypothetical protein
MTATGVFDVSFASRNLFQPAKLSIQRLVSCRYFLFMRLDIEIMSMSERRSIWFQFFFFFEGLNHFKFILEKCWIISVRYPWEFVISFMHWFFFWVLDLVGMIGPFKNACSQSKSLWFTWYSLNISHIAIVDLKSYRHLANILVCLGSKNERISTSEGWDMGWVTFLAGIVAEMPRKMPAFLIGNCRSPIFTCCYSITITITNREEGLVEAGYRGKWEGLESLGEC